MKRIVETDFTQDSKTPVEVEQIPATAEQNMLAVVDCLGLAWNLIAGSAAPKKGA
jgi:hypothetical protein